MAKSLKRTIAAAASLGVLLVGASLSQEASRKHPAHHPREMNKKFADPALDVEQFVRKFENESREVFAKRTAIAKAAGVQPGETVADIGAGTGLFTLLFADQVGPQGRVYAVDIAPAFLKFVADRAKRNGRSEVVRTVLNTQDSTGLPPDSCDVVFLCDTYHHFENPLEMLRSIHASLRPGGRLVLVDFDLRPDSSDSVKMRARAPKEVYYKELQETGFERIEVSETPDFKEHFLAVFRRLEGPPTAAQTPAKSSDEHPR